MQHLENAVAEGATSALEKLYAPFPFGRAMLRNRIVMAPMTRNSSPNASQESRRCLLRSSHPAGRASSLRKVPASTTPLRTVTGTSLHFTARVWRDGSGSCARFMPKAH
jgi:hypothetical protein